MINKYLYLLIALLAFSGCTKELDADQFTPCGDALEEIQITPTWTGPLSPTSSTLFKPMRPVEYNGFLIHCIGHGQEQIIVKRNLETKEIVLQKEIHRLDYDGVIQNNHELIYVELGRILALDLNTFDIRTLWDYNYSPHSTEIEEDISIINGKLVFIDLKQVDNSKYVDQLISLDITNLNHDVLFEWNEKPQSSIGIYRFKVWENINGNLMLNYLEGYSSFQIGFLSAGKLGCVNLTNNNLLYENDILEEYEDDIDIEGFEIFGNQVNIEMQIGGNLFTNEFITQYKSFNAETGQLLWSKDYKTAGLVFKFNSYNEARNSVIILSQSNLLELDLSSGEQLNEEIVVLGLISDHNFQIGSKLGFVHQYEIKFFDLEIGCITQSTRINNGFADNRVQNDIFYNELKKTIYAYNQSEFLAIPYP